MTDLIAPAVAESPAAAKGYIWLFGLVFLRVGAMVALFPALGEQVVPQRIKLAAAVSLTAIVAPLGRSAGRPAAGPFPAPAGRGRNRADPGLRAAADDPGAAIGRHHRRAVGVAGADVRRHRPRSAANRRQPAGAGGPGAVRRHRRAGPGRRPAGTILPDRAARSARPWRRVSPNGACRAFRRFSRWPSRWPRPSSLAALLYNLALGAINRAMPQLIVSFVGAPALTLGGLALLALCTPFLLAAWQEAMQAALAQPFGG